MSAYETLYVEQIYMCKYFVGTSGISTHIETFYMLHIWTFGGNM